MHSVKAGDMDRSGQRDSNHVGVLRYYLDLFGYVILWRLPLLLMELIV